MDAKTVNAEYNEDLLRQILNSQLKQEKYEKIKFILLAVGLAVLIAGFFLLMKGMNYVKTNVETIVTELTATSNSINDVAEELKDIDFKALEESYQSLATHATDAFKLVEEDTQKIKELVEHAQTSLEEADSVLDSISKIDFETLNNGIIKFNEILTPISNFFAAFGK